YTDEGQPRDPPDLDLLRRAEDNLSAALTSWPKSLRDLPADLRVRLENVEWSDETQTLAVLRNAEVMLLKLIRLRKREAERPGAERAKSGGFPDEWDALLDDGATPPQPLRFVGPSGKFEAGKGPDVPNETIRAVTQLALWMPYDHRLAWLLAELFNAKRD